MPFRKHPLANWPLYLLKSIIIVSEQSGAALRVSTLWVNVFLAPSSLSHSLFNVALTILAGSPFPVTVVTASGHVITGYNGIKTNPSVWKLTELLVLRRVMESDPFHASLFLSLDDAVGDNGPHWLHRARNKSMWVWNLNKSKKKKKQTTKCWQRVMWWCLRRDTLLSAVFQGHDGGKGACSLLAWPYSTSQLHKYSIGFDHQHSSS